jgi:CCR4-NOT transcriptional regulation complex NOT5 subunit
MEKERIERFWAKVAIAEPEECWLWTACVNSKGYGSFGVAPKKTASAHKVAWALAKNDGVMSDSKDHIMHSCDVKRCVNPQHLELGTPKQNARDAVARGLKVVHKPSERDTCNYGHPRTPENTHHKYNTCNVCRRISGQKAKEKQRTTDREAYNAYHREYYRANIKSS